MPTGEMMKVPFEDIVIERKQMRVIDTGKGIKELAQSIYIQGLLQPIMVCPSSQEGKFEIIAGQRRYLAYEYLIENGRIEEPVLIDAKFFEEKLSEEEAWAISLTENLMKLDPNKKDYLNICTDLYKKYGTIKAVSEETGIPRDQVSSYIKYPQLRQSLKTLYDEGKVDLKTALHANAAVYEEGKEGEEKAEELAIQLKEMGADQARRTRKIIVENPRATVTQAAAEARTQESHKITIVQSPTEFNALNKYAEEFDQKTEDAAGELLIEGLISTGYLNEDED